MTDRWLYKDQLNPVAELDTDGNLVALFIYGTHGHVPDAMVKSGARYLFVTDQIGSVRLVVNADTGAVVQRMEYDAWGNVTLDNNPGFQPFGFAGGLYDRDTKPVRFGHRDYDADAGRWTAKDPSLFVGGDVNLYRYATGDSINLADVNGRDVCVHRSSQDYRHEWVSFNNDPARSYGAWPSDDVFWGDTDTENPDLRSDEIGDPGTDTTCFVATPGEDQEIEEWIHEKYDLDDPSNNPPYFLGLSDCRHFTRDVLQTYDSVHDAPWWQFWRARR